MDIEPWHKMDCPARLMRGCACWRLHVKELESEINRMTRAISKASAYEGEEGLELLVEHIEWLRGEAER